MYGLYFLYLLEDILPGDFPWSLVVKTLLIQCGGRLGWGAGTGSIAGWRTKILSDAAKKINK